jgi:hypothetical protein
MPTSQFTVYSSSDSGAPVMNGQTGSLVNVLNKVLVTGYGAKVAAGWTADFTSSLGALTGSTFRPASGSRLYLSVRDDAPVNASEARIMGFENPTAYNSGSGQFPSYAQAITPFGYMSQRKSATVSTTPRNWVCYADAWTMYLFIQTGDITAAIYFGLWFGNIYSLAGTSDAYRTIIVSRETENSSTFDYWDLLNYYNGSTLGHYMARSWGGGGYSIKVGKFSDGSVGVTTYLNGFGMWPNGTDNTMNLAPIFVNETLGLSIRGRLRGLWQIGHQYTNFTDGDTFQGTGDYAGKTFRVLKVGPRQTNGDTHIAIETSATVETN